MTEEIRLPTYETLLTEAIRSLAVDSGTVTTRVVAGGNVLHDDTKNWAANVHKNRLVKIIRGTGAGQMAVIEGNSTRSLVIKTGWAAPLDTTSVYVILGADFAQILRDVFGGGSDISAANPLEVHDPKVGSLVSYEGITDADGAPAGATLVCSDLTTKPDYDGNLVIITSGPYAGQARDITGVTTGGTVTPHTAFGGQITSGTDFVIVGIRTTPAEVAALAADVGDASTSTLGSLYGILGDPEAALGDSMTHVPKYTGNIFYVDGVNGDDANSGQEPGVAKKTIGAAVTAASAGDRIRVKAATYNEAIDLNKDGLELICEQGAFLQNTTPGTVLIVSAAYCRVVGAILFQGGQTGLQVTGNFNSIENCLAFNCSVGFDIGGAENHTDNCRSIQHTTTGFNITGSYGIHSRLVAAGAGAVRGIYLSAGTADRNHFHDCHTLGNTTAGWQVDALADNNLFSGCSTAVDDGARVDNGTDNTWDDFSEGSQIVAGQSRDQDLKDIYDKVAPLPADPATEAKQDAIEAKLDAPDNFKADVSALALEATLTAIKGAGWTNETLKAIKDAVDAIVGGDATQAKQDAIEAKLDLPAADETANTRIGEVIGQKGDAANETAGQASAIGLLRAVITNYLADGTIGLSNLKALIDAIEGKLDDGTTGLANIKALIDALETKLDAMVPQVTETTDTFSFDETNAAEQDMVSVSIATRTKIGGIHIDMVNVTQDTTIKVYHKIDGANFREISSHSWVTTDADGVLLEGFTAYRDIKISLTCGGGGAGAVNVPYAIV